MSYEVPSLDTLLARVLQDYNGQLDRDGNAIDTTKGSITYIDANVLASALQGVYYRLKYTEQQTLANLAGAKTATINKWASIFGVTRSETDTDADVVQNIINKIQMPPAGGNENDWINWAKAIIAIHTNDDDTSWAEQVSDCSVPEGVRRPGSVDLYLLSEWSLFPEYAAGTTYEDGDYVKYAPVDGPYRIYECLQQAIGQTPSPAGSTSYWRLLGGCTDDAVTAAQTEIEEKKRALGLWDNQYHAASIVSVNVTVDTTGDIDDDDAESILRGYLDDNPVEKVGSLAKMISLLVDAGAETVDITVPSDDVGMDAGEKTISGTISVNPM